MKRQKFIPILRAIGQAGWEPVTYAVARPRELWLERYGDLEKGMFFTLYNPADKSQESELLIDFEKLGYGAEAPVTELVTGQEFENNDKLEIKIPPKSVRVFRIGAAPSPPAVPELSAKQMLKQIEPSFFMPFYRSGELLLNGDFELSYPDAKVPEGAKRVPMGWQIRMSGEDGKAELIDADAHKGSKCFHIYNSSEVYFSEVSQIIDKVEANQKYRLTFGVRHASDAKESGRLCVRWRGGGATYKDLPVSEDWTKAEWTLKAPEGARWLRISIGSRENDLRRLPGMDDAEHRVTEFWVDDVRLRKVSQ